MGEGDFRPTGVGTGATERHDVAMSRIGTVFAAVWGGRTWRAYAYLLAGLVLGVLWFSWSVTMYVTGAALVIIWVGIPILVFAQLSMRWIGTVERKHANQLLHARIAEPEPVGPRPGADRASSVWMRLVHWGGARIHDVHAWRVFAWTIARGVLGPVGFVVAIVALVVPVSVLAGAVIYTLVDVGAVVVPWEEAGGEPTWLCDWLYFLYPLSFVLAVGGAWLARGVASAHVPLARWALGPCASEVAERATVRAQLAEEQVRIDQELHDSIGHMITMTVIQAGAGAHVFDSDPAFARQALRNIEERGRAAMGELDRIIATLRGDEASTLAPLAGLAEIPALVEGSRGAGMTIESELASPHVAAAVGRAAFGIVREALTNAAKHAPGSRVTVAVVEDGDALGIRVVNGPARPIARPAESSGRHGVSGIRDRVALLGGASRIGETRDGGFEVLVLLPLGASLGAEGAPGSPWSVLRERVAP